MIREHLSRWCSLDWFRVGLILFSVVATLAPDWARGGGGVVTLPQFRTVVKIVGHLLVFQIGLHCQLTIFIYLFIQLCQVKLHEWHAYDTNSMLSSTYSTVLRSILTRRNFLPLKSWSNCSPKLDQNIRTPPQRPVSDRIEIASVNFP